LTFCGTRSENSEPYGTLNTANGALALFSKTIGIGNTALAYISDEKKA
jgi:hypothetical protein